MENRHSTAVGKLTPWRFLLKALALAFPWGIIEDALARHQHPSAGYAVGILVGLSCMYAVPPRDMALWRYLLIGAVAISLRLMLPH